MRSQLNCMGAAKSEKTQTSLPHSQVFLSLAKFGGLITQATVVAQEEKIEFDAK